MLKQLSMQMVGGNMPEPERAEIGKYIRQFEDILEKSSINIPPKIVRAKLSGSVYIVRDKNKIAIFYAPKAGNEVIWSKSEQNVIPSQLARELSLFRDIDDISAVILPIHGLTMPESDREPILKAVAIEFINRSTSEFEMKNSISAFSPIFGQNRFPVQDSLVFVLMPFTDELTKVYESIIKPTIENDAKLVSRRADEIHSNNPIMQDIWKSICESRIVLADLTGFNANVMYELGIAHTVGKPSLLIYQESDSETKFPFDLAHIRRINYKNDAAGGVKLRKDINAHINAMMNFEV